MGQDRPEQSSELSPEGQLQDQLGRMFTGLQHGQGRGPEFEQFGECTGGEVEKVGERINGPCRPGKGSWRMLYLLRLLRHHTLVYREGFGDHSVSGPH